MGGANPILIFSPLNVMTRFYKSLPYLLYTLLLLTTAQAQKLTVSGFVVEKGSRETIVGAQVSTGKGAVGNLTNAYGFFSLSMSATDTVKLVVSSMGYVRLSKSYATKNLLTNLLIELQPEARELQEVRVTGETDVTSRLGTMSSIRLNAKQVATLPALLGEKDILKVIQLLPGVQKGTEGSTALYVRGGGADQNLILLDDAPVYNANHLFGFFSVFNNDAINNMEFFKGGFPARYGGRASSVLDIRMKEGNRERFSGTGGIGIIASRLTLEGPMNKKSSFLVSGRRTYLDLLTKPFQSKKSRTGYYFYDLNAKLNYDLTKRDKVFLSGYFGQDALATKTQTGVRIPTTNTNSMGWGNATATLRWNHVFSQKLFLNTSVYGSHYQFGFSDETKRERPEGSQLITSEYTSKVADYGVRADLDYFLNNAHTLKAGLFVAQRQFSPRAYTAFNSQTGSQQEVVRASTNEKAVYINDIYQPSTRFTANVGFRAVQFRNGELNQFFLEPRLLAGVKLTEDLSIKASYARMNQPIHVLTNTGAGLPTDLWVPATKGVPPQQSDQVVIGIDKQLKKSGLTLTVEGYYKRINQIVAYQEGATFLVLGDEIGTFDWQKNVTSGRSWSYGSEVLLQRTSGRLTGWLGYTLSWTQQQFAALNGGKPFYARYDRRHDVSVVGTYQLSPKIILSGIWVYGTGNALTLPTASFDATDHSIDKGLQTGGAKLTDYNGRNSFRAAPYHRLDASVQFHRKKRWGSRFWEIGVYNAYNRRNPFYYQIATENVEGGFKTSVRRVSLFPVIPSVSYNFKF